MAELTIRFDLSFGARSVRLLTAAVMIFSAVTEVASESVTLTTYYPAPSGVYSSMITTGNTYLARDGGEVGIQTANPTAGYVMDVNGSMKVDGNGLYNNFQYEIVQTNANDWLRINPNNSWPDGTAAYGDWAFGTGGVSIGAWSDIPAGQLYVTGSIGVGTTAPTRTVDIVGSEGDYGYMPHYQNWATYGTGDGGAAIYNDAGAYQTLMLVGNNSNGNHGTRKVSVWDQLMVNGPVVPTDSACTETWYAIDGVTNCPGGQYATFQSGVISYWVMTPMYTNGVGSQQSGTAPMFCCNCPAAGCPL